MVILIQNCMQSLQMKSRTQRWHSARYVSSLKFHFCWIRVKSHIEQNYLKSLCETTSSPEICTSQWRKPDHPEHPFMWHHDSLVASPTMETAFRLSSEYLPKTPSRLRWDYLDNGIHEPLGNMRPEYPKIPFAFKFPQDIHQLSFPEMRASNYYEVNVEKVPTSIRSSS